MIQWARKTEGIYYHLDYSQTFKWISTHFYYFLEKRETRRLLALSVARRIRFWEHFGPFWQMRGASKNLLKNCSFCKVFHALGVVIWDHRGILTPCPYDAGRSWRQDGSKIDKNRPRWVQDKKKSPPAAILGPSWRQVGSHIFFFSWTHLERFSSILHPSWRQLRPASYGQGAKMLQASQIRTPTSTKALQKLQFL